MPTLLRLPEVAADTPAATLLEWPIAENTNFAAGDVLCCVETAKAVVEVEAKADGVILKTLVAVGTDVKVGDPIAVLGFTGDELGDLTSVLDELGGALGDAPASADAADEPVAVVSGETVIAPIRSSAAADNGRIFASPLARRMAQSAGLTLAEIIGTGPNNRIRRRDVEQAARSRVAAVPAASTATAPMPIAAAAGYSDQPHSRLRRAIAARLTDSKLSAPHFYLRGQARVDQLLLLRTQINALGGAKVSVNDLVIKAVAQAHTLVPAMNVIWTEDAVRTFDRVDIALAVATPNRLLTPVLRDVSACSLRAVAASSRHFAEQARSGGLKQHDLEGGSITVSNLGMYGTSEFAAIINPPQASILAVGAATEEPVVVDHEVRIGRVMRLTLSVDHRPVDGATAAEWMRTLIGLLENPVAVLA